jgi:hypothetical protein
MKYYFHPTELMIKMIGILIVVNLNVILDLVIAKQLDLFPQSHNSQQQ